jgi:hypothetical protein
VLTDAVGPAPQGRRTPEIITAPILRAGAAALGVAGLLVLLTWTMLTDASHLIADFPTDAWLMGHQADALRHGTFPSLTLTSPWAAFYPEFAFYGGTLFAFGGTIALLVGSSMVAEIIVYLLALAAAYGGWLWLARLAGVRSWPAHAPAILYVTAPYVLTNINVRQDLAEIVATAMIPPMVAAALSVLRADRLRAGPAAALAASSIIFGGSHNLTLLWGTTVLTVAVLVVAVCVPQARSLVTKRGALRVLAIVVPAMAVNAWYLLPDLAYHADTIIANRIDEWKALLSGPHPELTARNLFGLGHPTADPGSGFTITLPVLAMAWVVVAALVGRASWREAWGRTLVVLMLLTAGVLTVMVNPSWIVSLPDAWTMIQFSYRLETFALFGICGAVIVALVLLEQRAHRWLIGLLLPILMLSVISAAVQRHDAPRTKFRPPTNIDRFSTFNIGDFADGTLTRQPAVSGPAVLHITRANLKRGVVTGNLRVPPGELVYTNVMTPSRMLHVEGARVVGRWPAPPLFPGWQDRWALVLKVNHDATPGTAHLVIREARSLPIVGGRIISILGLLGLVANAAVMARAGWRRRRAR